MRDQPRCYDHYKRPELPPLCSTCQRIAVEHEIVKRVVDALLAAGFYLRTDEKDDPRPQVPSKDRAAIIKEIAEVDDEFLAVFREIPSPDRDVLVARPDGWVRFVYGNDGWEVICDYTVNLEPVLQPILDYCETLM